MTDNSPENKLPTTKKKKVVRWRCPNCGQMFFTAPDDEPPDICHYCRDMTTWQRVNDEENGNHQL